MSADSLLTPALLTTGSGAASLATSATSKDSPEKIREAASQFEALLIGQILKSAHDEDGGWLGTGEDQTASSAMGLADEYFARAMASRGGLGLGKVVAAGLEKRSAPQDPPLAAPVP